MWRAVNLVTLIAVLALAGCLGGLPDDPQAEAIAIAAREALGLPVRESRPYWLLRSAPGWQGGHEIRFGGDPQDAAIAGVRVARFSDPAHARAAYARLTPAYVYAVARDRMTGDPNSIDYPQPLAGEEHAVYLFGVKLPPDLEGKITLTGQVTVLRAGRTVILVESIGVHPEQLVPAMAEAVAAAGRIP